MGWNKNKEASVARRKWTSWELLGDEGRKIVGRRGGALQTWGGLCSFTVWEMESHEELLEGFRQSSDVV